MFSAAPQRNKIIEEPKLTDALFEYAVTHGETEETERLREKLRKLAERL